MASIVLKPAVFAVGTSVAVFPRSARHDGRAPVGSSVTSASVASDSTLSFSGLEDDTEYTAYALVSGVHRYADFGTNTPVSTFEELVARVVVVEEAPLSIVGYGDAVGGNTGDQSAAINATITQAANSTNGRGRVLIEGDTFRTTGTINFAENVEVVGCGPKSTISYAGSSYAILMGSGTLAGADDTAWVGLALRDVSILGTSAAGAAVRVRGATRWAIDRVFASGFTTGYAIKLDGASFIGRINGGRLKGNYAGIGGQKVGADGSDGRGQAFNAIEVAGQIEIQNNTYGVLIGDPTTTETTPVVGMGASIHDACIEGNTYGIWNVACNKLTVRDTYFEGNTSVDIRAGSTDGNTSIPVLMLMDGNFHYVKNIGVDLARGLRTRIRDSYFVADSADTTSGIVVGPNVAQTTESDCFFNTIDTPFTNSGTLTIRHTRGSGSPESSIVAGVGSTYHRDDGGASTSLYIKESGTGSTGWVAK